jgi:peptidoglycan/xylan/chitin deacetylase (PgdA/CDA1 family)
VIALTFDAGANDAALASILATLKAKNVTGTFFLTGAWINNFPGQTKTIHSRGYVIGNHTQTHPDLRTLSDSAVRAELTKMEASLRNAIGSNPRPVFRFPFGAVDSRVLKLVNDSGYVSVRWTVDTLGWKGTSGGQSTATVTKRVLDAAKPGAIVLMHVGSHPQDRSTLDADALPGIIDELKSRGYRFVGLELLLP